MVVNITDDFQGGTTGWTDNTTATDADFSQYLQLTNASASPVATQQTFDVSAADGDITVTFDLYEIDDTDSDDFLVFVNGVEVFSLTFSDNTDEGVQTGITGDVSFVVDSVAAPANIGEGSGNDQIHRVTLTITNNGDDLTLGFGETLTAGPGNESFGVDNLSITRVDAVPPLDTDGDGVADLVDVDDDNDGILDVDEGGVILADSGIDGTIGVDDGVNDNTNIDIEFNLTSADPDSPFEPHVLDSIEVNGQVFTDFILPDDFTANSLDGTMPLPTSGNVALTVNGVLTGLNSTDADYEDEILTQAFQSRNLNAYQSLNGEDFSNAAFTLSYDAPITIGGGGFIAITERGGNNSTTVTAFDEDGNELGSITARQNQDYLQLDAQQNSSQDVEIALYSLDDIGPIGGEISYLTVTFPDNSNDAPDGKIFIFGDQTQIQERDTDEDGIVDRLDLDSDNDLSLIHI